MPKQIVKDLCQVALYAPDPSKLAEFYTTVLGLEIVAHDNKHSKKLHSRIYLSTQSKSSSYQVAIIDNHDIQHIAFEVNTLTDLKNLYKSIVERDLSIRWTLNHGVSLAFYFRDPADNLIKLYWSTGKDCPQPYGYPIDLSQSEAALQQHVTELVAELNLSPGINHVQTDDE